MDSLVDKIRKQMVAIRAVGKTPTKIVCDLDSFSALMDGLGPIPEYSMPSNAEIRIFGLAVEFTYLSNLEVQ